METTIKIDEIDPELEFLWCRDTDDPYDAVPLVKKLVKKMKKYNIPEDYNNIIVHEMAKIDNWETIALINCLRS